MAKCKCVLCGNEYETCNCSSDKKNKSYKIIADSAEHYQIHLIITDYVFGNISKENAKEMLNKFNLNDYNSFNKTAKLRIDEIMKESNDDSNKIHKILEDDIDESTTPPLVKQTKKRSKK